MTYDAAVISGLYGGYDTLKPAVPQAGLNVDWVLVTDDVSIRSGTLGWRVVHRPQPGTHPNRAAKYPKLFPWEFTEAPASVWLDASFRVQSPDFVTGALACTSYAEPVAQFVHPWRDCIYTEAEESAKLAKYAGEPVLKQAAYYREGLGHPEHWGLWATGVIARQHDVPAVKELGHCWATLIDRWTFQDQISQPVALRGAGLRPVALPGTHFANPWLTYEGSERH